MQWLVRGEAQVPSGALWLTDAEAARAAGMRFTKRRNEYLVRRYAGKCAVAAVVGLGEDPASLGRIGVLNRPTGAPYAQVDGRALGLDISLTDRAGWAVCLVGADLAAVGVDLEIVEPRSRGFVSDFLTPAEQALVAGASGPDGPDATANLIWSAKESALKVLRTGLRADTRTVEVALADGGAVDTRAGMAGTGAEAAGTEPDGAQADGAGWRRLTVTGARGTFPGWWRRDGVFVLTVVASAGLEVPPVALPGSAPLEHAEPVHSWLARPRAD